LSIIINVENERENKEKKRLSRKKSKKMSSLYYGTDGTNLNYSIRQQLSGNNITLNDSSSSSPSCPILDYYGEDFYHQRSSRTAPLYQDDTNQFYRYNPLSSTPSNQAR
jgi:hypothetical protein